MPLTSIPAAPAALSAALANLVPGGSTSIGSGLQKAQALVGSGSHSRKAILLLTDGQENTPPYIADVADLALGDTHVCSIGFGASRDLDGPKLQDLSERQGGIYMSTASPLELKKFFVFCFANIFDTFVGKDPFGTLPSNQLVSAPTVHRSLLDEKIVFVLSWTNPSPPRTLMLAITTPSGNVLDLDAPGVESKFGPTWHIVRFKPPFKSERDGNWTARAIRPIDTYVNGFSSRSFADFDQGVALVRNEIANLCPHGCRKILYYEDTTVHTSFVGHNSVYSEALFMESGQHALGNITRPANATEFFKILQQEIRNEETSFDLLVYSSQFTQSEQPYDSVLAKILCSNSLRSIISDNRHTQGAREILRCAGALRGKHTNFTTLLPTDSLLLDRPYKLHSSENVLDFSYELLLTNRTVAQATSDTNAVAVLARGRPGKDEEFFITVLTRAAAKVKPFNFRKNTYTLEPLHPAFHIPDMYWPKCGYDKVEATVNITRPLRSLAKLLASVGSTNGTSLNGDPLNIRQAAARRLEEQGVVIPTETKQYQLYDDGTHGDTTANDHYWEINLPSDFTAVDGDYHLHAFFRLCKRNRCGPDSCVDREAQQIITVRAQMDPKCKVTVEKLQPNGYQSKARILIKPVDRKGTPLGPGLVDELILMPIGGVKIESKSDYDGCGTYQILVTWEKKKGEKPGLIITQFGRPKNAIRVKL
ncbi:hypothetical protein BGZ81_009979 [Podila clonocystis]|nr:hypothetical protein BGZ81_009979 [Podila clonocystis]